MARKARRKWAAGVQLLACACLLFFSLVPLLPALIDGAPSGPTCSGDHRICGCSPHRVASKTCCCFRVPDCCLTEAEVAEPSSGDAHGASRNASLTSLPCGREMVMHLSAQDLVLLMPRDIVNGPYLLAGIVSPGGSSNAIPELFLSPPVPPPRFIPSF